MLTVAVPKRNKLPNIIVLTPKDGTVICAAAAATMFVFMQRIEEKPDKIMLQNC